VLTERVEQGKEGECTQRMQIAWLLLGLAVAGPWLALGGPKPTDLNSVLLTMGCIIVCIQFMALKILQ